MNGDRPGPSFDVNEYERTNEQWQCGRACEGTPCARGPDSRGQCGAICEPLKIGDHFYCENASVLSGKCDDGPLPDGSCCHWPALCEPQKKGRSFVCGLGLCSEGPRPDGSCCQPLPPCRPVRRVLGKRRLVTLVVFTLALGTGLLMVGGPARQSIVSPGPLTSHHSAIADQCSACHEAGEGTLVDWMHSAVTPKDHDAAQQKCLKCHRPMKDHSQSPHTISPDILAGLTREAKTRDARGGSFLLNLARDNLPHGSQIECFTCHREHQGVRHDLKAMSDKQCQVCHVWAFESFSQGHPELKDYPYTRRSRIYFDHVSHYGVHFRETGRLPDNPRAKQFQLDGAHLEQTCARCHVPDAAKKKMRVRHFQNTCGACHAEQIDEPLSPGMLVLRFPVVDEKARIEEETDQKAFSAADHPQAEGTVSPILRLLLSANPEFKKLDRFVSGLDLLNLESATPQQLAAVRALPKLITAELKKMAGESQSQLESRLSLVLGKEVSTQQIEVLAQLVSPEVIRDVSQSLLKEGSNPAPGKVRGFTLNPGDLTLRYDPQGHADPILKAWIDLSVQLGQSARSDSPLHQLYESLTQVNSAGRCMKCHTIDTAPDGRPMVNWLPYQGGSLGWFTRFSHRPHIVMLEDHACLECHALDTKGLAAETWSPLRSSYFDLQGHALPASGEFSSNFLPMQKKNCTTCHQAGRAIQDCTTCHSYHDKTSAAWLSTERGARTDGSLGPGLQNP